MRYLFWFSIGYGAACAGFSYGRPFLWLIPVCAMLAVCGVAIWKDTRILWGFCLGILGIVVAWGSCNLFSHRVIQPLAELDGKTAEKTVIVSGDCWETKSGMALDGQVVMQGRAYSARVYLREIADLQPGDGLRGQFRFSLTEADSYLPGNRVYLILSSNTPVEIIPGVENPLRYFGAMLHQKNDTVMAEVFAEDVRGIAKGIFLGDTTLLDYETDTALKICGMRHTVAVSGMHLGVLFAILFALCGKHPLPALLLSAPVLAVYGMMVGFTSSVTRAYWMLILFLVSMVARRQYDVLTSLAFAVILMLTENPYVITSVGFQLSVAGVLGIALFRGSVFCRMRRLFPWKSPILVGLINAFSVAVSALTFTTPICAWHFGTVSLIGMVLNPLMGGVITVIFSGVLLSCGAGALYLPLGKTIGAGVGWIIRFLRWVVIRCARLPLAAVYTKSGLIVAWLVLVYLLLGLSILQRGRHLGRNGCIAALGLCLAVGTSWILPLMDDARVTVLDVGQGQSVILQHGNRTYLVDCGGDYDDKAANAAAETLLSMGISRIDGVIVSHYDWDHCGGIPAFLQRIRADALILPDYGEREAFTGQLAAFDGEIHYARQNMEITGDGMELSVFVPVFASNSNESSLCVLFQTEKCVILITGDQTTAGEERLIARRMLPKLTALIVGHHGAATATGSVLLDAVCPEIAVISVGKNNYGHPAEAVIDRLLAHGCEIFRTDRNGTVVIRR